MARLLHHRGPITLLSITSTSGTTAIFVIVAVLALCSIVSFLCATHERFKSNNKIGRRGGSARKLTAGISDIGSRAYVKMGKLISWKREEEVVELEEEEVVELEEEEAVWKKTILKGERCRPLESPEKQVVMLVWPEKGTTTASS